MNESPHLFPVRPVKRKLGVNHTKNINRNGIQFTGAKAGYIGLGLWFSLRSGGASQCIHALNKAKKKISLTFQRTNTHKQIYIETNL